MTGKDLKEWLDKLTDEELELEIFADEDEEGTFYPMGKVCICRKLGEDEKAIFLEMLPEEEYYDEEDAPEAETPEETMEEQS